jgi:hypothetical protein
MNTARNTIITETASQTIHQKSAQMSQCEQTPLTPHMAWIDSRSPSASPAPILSMPVHQRSPAPNTNRSPILIEAFLPPVSETPEPQNPPLFGLPGPFNSHYVHHPDIAPYGPAVTGLDYYSYPYPAFSDSPYLEVWDEQSRIDDAMVNLSNMERAYEFFDDNEIADQFIGLEPFPQYQGDYMEDGEHNDWMELLPEGSVVYVGFGGDDYNGSDFMEIMDSEEEDVDEGYDTEYPDETDSDW